MKPSSLSKSGALGLSLVLFITNGVLAYSPESNFWAERKRMRTNQFAALPRVAPLKPLPGPQTFISPQFGTLRKINRPHATQDTQKTVIHIQDVHHNADAQKNIGLAIQELIQNNKIDLIALEGAFGPIDLKPFKTFPRQDTIRKAADYLLREHKISGPIRQALVSQEKTVPIVGVEDRDQYEANVAAVKRSAKSRPRVLKDIRDGKREMREEKEAVFNRKLLRFDRVVEQYREGEMGLGAFIKKLHPSSSQTISTFLKALRLEESINFTQVERERTQLLHKLTKRMSAAQTNELVKSSVAFRLGQMTHHDFYQSLKHLCQTNRISLGRYPALNDYIHYVLLSNQIKADTLFKDIRAEEEKKYANLAKTQEERDLIKASRRLYLTEKLVAFSLTKEEWEEYKTIFNFPFSIFNQFSSSDLQTNGSLKIGHQKFIENRKLKMENSPLAPFENFYKQAEARDKSLASNLLTAMTAHNAQRAVLVTGGFHEKGINKALQEKGIHSFTFVPKINKIDKDGGTAYLSVFTQEKTPLEQLFKGEKLFLATQPNKGLLYELPLISIGKHPNLASHYSEKMHAQDESGATLIGVDGHDQRVRVSIEETPDELKSVTYTLVESSALALVWSSPLYLVSALFGLSFVGPGIFSLFLTLLFFLFDPKSPYRISFTILQKELAVPLGARLLSAASFMISQNGGNGSTRQEQQEAAQFVRVAVTKDFSENLNTYLALLGYREPTPVSKRIREKEKERSRNGLTFYQPLSDLRLDPKVESELTQKFKIRTIFQLLLLRKGILMSRLKAPGAITNIEGQLGLVDLKLRMSLPNIFDWAHKRNFTPPFAPFFIDHHNKKISPSGKSFLQTFDIVHFGFLFILTKNFFLGNSTRLKFQAELGKYFQRIKQAYELKGRLWEITLLDLKRFTSSRIMSEWKSLPPSEPRISSGSRSKGSKREEPKIFIQLPRPLYEHIRHNMKPLQHPNEAFYEDSTPEEPPITLYTPINQLGLPQPDIDYLYGEYGFTIVLDIVLYSSRFDIKESSRAGQIMKKLEEALKPHQLFRKMSLPQLSKWSEDHSTSLPMPPFILEIKDTLRDPKGYKRYNSKTKFMSIQDAEHLARKNRKDVSVFILSTSTGKFLEKLKIKYVGQLITTPIHTLRQNSMGPRTQQDLNQYVEKLGKSFRLNLYLGMTETKLKEEIETLFAKPRAIRHLRLLGVGVSEDGAQRFCRRVSGSVCVAFGRVDGVRPLSLASFDFAALRCGDDLHPFLQFCASHSAGCPA